MQPNQQNRLVAHGMAVGLHSSLVPGLEFDLQCPYTYCRICGSIFQSPYDRETKPDSPAMLVDAATAMRREWSYNHASSHTSLEHMLLELSGLWLLAEAAHKLAAFGIIPVSDMVLNPEIADALATSKPIPVNDAEGSRN